MSVIQAITVINAITLVGACLSLYYAVQTNRLLRSKR